MGKRTVLAVVAALGLGGGIGLAAPYLATTLHRGDAAVASHPAWTEVPWPFLMDQWGKGKAFRCKAADCGADVDLYVRAKIGFCNCTTGVADDEELERVADVSLIDSRYAALAPGQAITVGRMAGRSRPYVVAGRARERAIAFAFNERCDVIVATAVVADERPTTLEPAVLAFLNGDIVMRWAEVTLGL
jgi:hypothetical protein